MMTAWATIRLAYPLADLDLANRAGAILDPDQGGDRTFDGRTMLIGGAEYIYADIPMQAPKPAIVQARDPATWHAVLSGLAAAKGLEPLTLEECEHLCTVALVGAECMADDPPIPEDSPSPPFDTEWTESDPFAPYQEEPTAPDVSDPFIPFDEGAPE